jgi:flagellar hook-basal body complex protein FliE
MPAIDPSFLTSGGHWSIGGAGGAGTAEGVTEADGGTGGDGFGRLLTDQLDALQRQQVDAAAASRAVADGTATDPSTAVIAVERARLSMQLASQLRTKGVEAINDLLHTQV